MVKPYQRIRFNRAIAWFRRKIPLPTRRWDEIINAAQNWAFTIAGVESATILNTIQDKIQSILEGRSQIDTFADFKATFREQMAKAGYADVAPWRTTLVYRNNINSAYNGGRWENIQESPDEYVQYWHDHPINPRPAHLALHKKVFRKDDPILEKLSPPLGHGCLCKLLSVSQADVDDEGLEVTTLSDTVKLKDRISGKEYEVPAIRVDGELLPVVEPGFLRVPNSDESRQEILEGAIARLSPDLQEKARNRINGFNQNR